MPRKRYLLVLAVVLSAFGARAWVTQPDPRGAVPTCGQECRHGIVAVLPPITSRLTGDPVVILGDSIAHGTCCSTEGPADYFIHPVNLAVDGNQIARVTALLPEVHAKRVFLHVGVNDVGRDNPNTERDWAALLAAMKARSQTKFVVVEIGPMNPGVSTPQRDARRDRLNARLRALKARNVTVLPFVATSLFDGLHPDDVGYRQQMPLVVRAFSGAAKSPAPTIDRN